MMLRSVVAFALTLGLATPSISATLEVVNGKVSLNQGNGFKVVTGILDAQPGDRILVDNGGLANIVYTNGCTIKLGDAVKRSVITVPAEPPCGSGLLPTGGQVPEALVTGVVVAGAVTGGIILAASSGKDKPSSP